MLQAAFKGFIDVDKNAFFVVEVKNKYATYFKHYELKDGINPDQFKIGENYDISGLFKDA